MARGSGSSFRSPPTSKPSRPSARSSRDSRRAEPAWSRAFGLIDEGLGAVIDVTKPAIVRAYLPGRRPRRGRGRDRRRVRGSRPPAGIRAASDRRHPDAARPRGRLGRGVEEPLPGAADRAAAGDPAHVARARGASRRRGSLARPGHGLRDGAASHDAAVPRGSGELADEGLLAHGRAGGTGAGARGRTAPRASSTWAAARGSWRSPRAARGGRAARRRHGPDRGRVHRPPTRRSTTSPGGCGSGRAACPPARAPSTWCWPI